LPTARPLSDQELLAVAPWPEPHRVPRIRGPLTMGQVDWRVPKQRKSLAVWNRKRVPTRADHHYRSDERKVLERINLPSRLLILVAVATVPALLVMVYLQLNLLNDGRKRITAEALGQADS